MDTFFRSNKVIPAVLVLLALFVFTWVVAAAFLGGPEAPVSNQTNFAQQEGAEGSESYAPNIENRDVESYAAYQSKDPFRQLLVPAESTEATNPEGTSFEETTSRPGGDAGGGGAVGGGAVGGGAGRGGAGGGASAGASDSDGDGLSTNREEVLGLDPRNPDEASEPRLVQLQPSRSIPRPARAPTTIAGPWMSCNARSANAPSKQASPTQTAIGHDKPLRAKLCLARRRPDRSHLAAPTGVLHLTIVAHPSRPWTAHVGDSEPASHLPATRNRVSAKSGPLGHP